MRIFYGLIFPVVLYWGTSRATCRSCLAGLAFFGTGIARLPIYPDVFPLILFPPGAKTLTLNEAFAERKSGRWESGMPCAAAVVYRSVSISDRCLVLGVACHEQQIQQSTTPGLAYSNRRSKFRHYCWVHHAWPQGPNKRTDEQTKNASIRSSTRIEGCCKAFAPASPEWLK